MTSLEIYAFNFSADLRPSIMEKGLDAILTPIQMRAVQTEREPFAENIRQGQVPGVKNQVHPLLVRSAE